MNPFRSNLRIEYVSTTGRWPAALVALLAALAVYHLGKGVYYLAVQQPPAGVADLLNRRIENAYFLDRVSPLSQYFLHEYEQQHDMSAKPWAIGAEGSPVPRGVRRWAASMDSTRCNW